MKRTLVGAVWLAACLWLMGLVAAPPATAHASLLRADPDIGGAYAAAPQAVTLWFSEPVELRYSSVLVLDASGREIASEPEELLDAPAEPAIRLPLRETLPPGSYTVIWSVFSRLDAHVSSGYYSFTVGTALLPTAEEQAALVRNATRDTGVPLAIEAGVRWLNLLAQAALAGALAFVLLVLAPALGESDSPARVPVRRLRLLLASALLVLVAGHLAAALVQTIDVTRAGLGDALGRPLVTLLTETRYGGLWLMRAGVLVALGVLCWALTRGEWLVLPRGQGRRLWAMSVGSAQLLLLTTSLGSHSASLDASFAVAVDWLHLAATSLWIGGLAALLVILPATRATASDAALTGRVVSRFSTLALGAGILLVVTGLISARRLVVGWEGLTTTRYGVWFTLKLAIAAAALGLGAYQLLVVRPRMAHSPGAATGRLFRRMLRAEGVLVVLVVAATGVLTSSAPARDLIDSTVSVFATTRLTPEASVTLRATPGHVGSNEFSLVVVPLDPDTFGVVEGIELRFDRAGGSVERLALRPAGPGEENTYLANGALLSGDGEWTVTAVIQRSAAPEIRVPFEVTARGSALWPSGLPAPAQRDVSAARLLGTLWLAAGLALGIAGWRQRRQRLALASGLLALALVSVALGSLVLAAGGMAMGV
jgi:copper transport protein